MKKTILLCLLCFWIFLSKAQDKAQQDSLLFLNTKAEFILFEQAQGHYIQTNNTKMHYLTWGKSNRTPIVWVHGTGSNGYELFGLADSLVKQGYYVIAIDYYGHGFTPIPDKEVSLYHVADDIKFLLDNLKIKKAVIGGWSRGGSIATAFYDAYPARVLGLILEDGGSVAAPAIDHSKSIDSCSVEITKRYQEYEQFVSQKYESAFEAIKKNGDINKKGDVFAGLAAIKQNTSGKWVIGQGISELIGFNSAGELLTMTYRPFASNKLFGTSYMLLNPKIIYRNLDVPMLILDPVSDNDFMPVEKENEKLQKAHPNLIIHKIYKNTSHALKYERPNEFLKDVISFLSRVKTFK
jgi:pimeloyl-ACP methyl ester carboxylesterase